MSPVKEHVVAPDAFFDMRREQSITLAKSHAIPTLYHNREFVAAGGSAARSRVAARGARAAAGDAGDWFDQRRDP